MATSIPEPLVIFDGECNLCSFSARLIHQLDRRQVFSYMFLQDIAVHTSADQTTIPGSVLILFEGKVFQKSTALIQVFKSLDFPWSLFALLRFIPIHIRDTLYDWIAENRYVWFGRKNHCSLPGPALQDRLINIPLSRESNLNS